MPPDSIKLRQFSEASDVWSWAVLVCARLVWVSLSFVCGWVGGWGVCVCEGVFVWVGATLLSGRKGGGGTSLAHDFWFTQGRASTNAITGGW